ncbi:hypothetical protein CALVIDRAFT_166386 [Calocera viscosa TUFC12733]|uniref:Uncharacterized protein n=1 Tax=Calocera viscosa (strain TUFC12733) TaxID=1330018 RepID=A0A167LH48_CALVF|nr:hypothetical protein CALVIDRAFT_166386 [Calocera viscosa TUFC12733]
MSMSWSTLRGRDVPRVLAPRCVCASLIVQHPRRPFSTVSNSNRTVGKVKWWMELAMWFPRKKGGKGMYTEGERSVVVPSDGQGPCCLEVLSSLRPFEATCQCFHPVTSIRREGETLGRMLQKEQRVGEECPRRNGRSSEKARQWALTRGAAVRGGWLL